MKKIIIIVIALLVLAFGYWTISPLFIDKEVQEDLPIDTSELSPGPLPEVPADDTDDTSAPKGPSETSVEGPFPITGTLGHPASGDIKVVRTPNETIVRFENYDGTNGPDLRIYLASDLEATEFVDLGGSRGNKGNINYSVPGDVDIDDYPYVMTWCRAFGVLFDSAKIN